MSKGRVLGLAAGALLLLGVQLIAGAATAAAEDNPAEISAATGGVDRATYHERQGQGRGNIYGSQVLSGIRTFCAADTMGRQVTVTTIPRIAITDPALAQPTEITARQVTALVTMRVRTLSDSPVVADSYYGSTGSYSQYYSHRYYPTRPRRRRCILWLDRLLPSILFASLLPDPACRG